MWSEALLKEYQDIEEHSKNPRQAVLQQIENQKAKLKPSQKIDPNKKWGTYGNGKPPAHLDPFLKTWAAHPDKQLS